MSYAKAMKWGKRHPKGIKNNYMGSSILGANERRKSPWLGSAWFEEGMEEERKAYIKEWHEETERLLKANPKLRLID
jgi:hypothetical protein